LSANRKFPEEIERVTGEEISILQFAVEKITNRSGREFIFTFVHTLATAPPASKTLFSILFFFPTFCLTLF
jgi:hypothetical protein